MPSSASSPLPPHLIHPCPFLSGRAHIQLSRTEKPKNLWQGKARHVTYSQPMGSKEEKGWMWRLLILE